MRDRHQDNLKKKLELLKAQQGVEPSEQEAESRLEVKAESEEDAAEASCSRYFNQTLS